MITALAAANLGFLALAVVEPAPITRIWVEQVTVGVRTPFWIHLEGTGAAVELPQTLDCPGLRIDPIDVRDAVFSQTTIDAAERTYRRSFLARAEQPGIFTIPFQELVVDGARRKTEALTITAVTRPDLVAAALDRRDDTFDRENIVFIDMAVDRREVYQGEPILFSTELWRVISPRIDSGPYGESRIVLPSTEGFFVENLEPVSRTDVRDDWDYDVWEERMILYPTVVGEAVIGRWHWEGVALIDTPGRRRRDRLYYQLNVGPIPLSVRALPTNPEGFSGAVGSFQMDVEVSGAAPLQGVPFIVAVTLRGRGNPYAMGDPILPALDWADAGAARREIIAQGVDAHGRQFMEKRFTYSVTPLISGAHSLPPIVFTSFNPDTESFDRLASAPREIVVTALPDQGRTLVVSEAAPMGQQDVEILADDIHPPIAARDSLSGQPPRGRIWRLAAAALLPILLYAALVALARARGSRPAPSRAAQSWQHDLHAAAENADPLGHVYQVVSRQVAMHASQTATSTLTPGEAEAILIDMGASEATRCELLAILQECERARYSDATGDSVDVAGVVLRAEAAIAAFDAEVEGRRP